MAQGTVQVLKGDKEIRKMGKGDSFGEQALYYNTVRGATVKALDNVIQTKKESYLTYQTKCLALGRDTLTKVLGDQVQIITFKNVQKWAIEKDLVLNQLTKLQTEKLVDNMKVTNYKTGNVIYAKGSPCAQKVVILIEGNLKMSKSGQLVAKKGETYGSEYLRDGSNEKK